MTKVKVCGITNLEDALAAAELGADAIGFIFAESLRRVSPDVVSEILPFLPPFIVKVGVFVDEEEENVLRVLERCPLDVLQFHGSEPPAYCEKFKVKVVKAFRVRDEESLKAMPEYKVSAYLLDTYVKGKQGGTGVAFNWDIALKAKQYGRVILAGGLTPANVAQAVKQVRPYAVDVGSGVESEPGRKDYSKMKSFIQDVRRVDIA